MRLRIAFTIAMMIVPSVGKAVEIGDFPALSQLIEKADAVVILRIDQHLDVRPNPTLYTTHKCYIYQTLKGDIAAEKSIALRLMDTRTSFVTPFALSSTHLMFLTKKRTPNEPTDFRTIEFQGANIALSPFGHEKPPKGKTVSEKVMHLVRSAIDYRKQQHEKEQRFLSLLQGEKTATAKVSQSPNDEPAKERSLLRVAIAHVNYDKKCKLLSVNVKLENSGPKPVFVVSNDFGFVKQLPGATVGHELRVIQQDDRLILDLSFLEPTADGVDGFRNMGTYGFFPPLMEIRPGHFRYITYVFQFPLELDTDFSETNRVPAPKRKTDLVLRFGYGSEYVHEFTKRVFRKDETFETANKKIVSWNKRIVTQWQEIVSTDPIEVDFR